MKYGDELLYETPQCLMFLEEGESDLIFNVHNCSLQPQTMGYSYYSPHPFVADREFDGGIWTVVKTSSFSAKRHLMTWKIWTKPGRYNTRLKRNVARNRIGNIIQRDRLDIECISNGFRDRNCKLRFDSSRRLNIRYGFGCPGYRRCHIVKRSFIYVPEIPAVSWDIQDAKIHSIKEAYEHMLNHVMNGDNIPDDAFKFLDMVMQSIGEE